jgi:ABC-2 type transport system permease protein
VSIAHPFFVFWFGLMGSLMLSFLGLVTSLWADKFDHAAAVTNFVVAPLSLLSGTFYSVKQLAPTFQAVSHANPFFYAISGFRYGFLGISDSPIAVGAVGLLVLNLILWGICFVLLRRGWKIKA